MLPINSETVKMLCSPANHEPLVYRKNKSDEGIEGYLIGVFSGKRFPVQRGVPLFIDSKTIEGTKHSDFKFYQRIAPVYDKLHKLQALSRGGEKAVRQKFLQKLNIKENDKVLEVAVGTGANLRYLPKHAKYYGIDISWPMLSQCLRMKQHDIVDVELILSDAINMPFKTNTFDVVFNVCAFRLFSDQEKAVEELMRVAKPGGTVVIVDQQKAGAPAHLLPPNVSDVKTENIDEWKLYYLSFTKPKRN